MLNCLNFIFKYCPKLFWKLYSVIYIWTECFSPRSHPKRSWGLSTDTIAEDVRAYAVAHRTVISYLNLQMHCPWNTFNCAVSNITLEEGNGDFFCFFLFPEHSFHVFPSRSAWLIRSLGPDRRNWDPHYLIGKFALQLLLHTISLCFLWCFTFLPPLPITQIQHHILL